MKSLTSISRSIKEKHKNVVVDEVNDHCLRLAVNDGTTYAWHCHPNSEELFLVLEGKLVIEFRDRHSVTLLPGESFKVGVAVIHRTIAVGRTVNLCFESKYAETVFVNDGETRPADSRVILKTVSPFAPDVLDLIEQLNQNSLSLYSAEFCHLDPPEVLARENCIMIGGYDGATLCGIGAVKFFADYGEIKRMFVPPSYRGRGISHLILDELIRLVKVRGLTCARLETGTKHEAAMILYGKKGFRVRGPFGDYVGGDPSVYMERPIEL